MKRIFAIVLALTVNLSNVVFAAQYKDYPINMELPTGWSFECKDSDSNVYVEEGCIIMSSQKTSKGSTYAQLYTDSFTFTGMQVVRLKMKIDSVSGYRKRFYVNNGNDKDLLLLIEDGVMTSGDIEENLPVDEFFDLDLGIDVSNGKVHYWVNSEYIGEATIDFTDYVDETVYLHFWNGFTSKTISTVWCISNFERIEDAEYNITSVPEENSTFIDVTSIEKIDINIDTVIPDLKNKNITLEMASMSDMEYSEIEFTKDCDNRILEIIPINGFEPLKSYRLTVPTGKDVFNVNHTDNYVLEFTTAPEGYVAPQGTISSEYNSQEIIIGEMVELSADITRGSAELVKVELYRNDELIKTFADSFDYSLKVLGGLNEFYLKFYDAEGACVKSNVVTVIGKENTPPVITTDAINDIKLQKGDKLSFAASDAEGDIKSLSLRLDGKKVAEIAGDRLEWSVPESMEFGKHELEVIAADKHNMIKKEAFSISVEKYASSEKINADYSKFSATLTGGTTEVASGISACPKANDKSKNFYIKGGTIDTEHGNCAIMGADTKTEGNTSWLGVLSFTDTTRPSETVIIETDIYVSSTHTLGSMYMKDADTGESCTLIQFYKDKVYYFNGSTNLTMPLQTQKWYDIKLIIDLSKGTYSLWLDGVNIMENYELRDEVRKLSCIRWEFYNYETNPAFVATSKFIISENVAYPTIKLVTFTHEEVESDSDTADTFIFQLTSPVDGKRIVAKDFKLFVENKELDFTSYEIIDSDIFVKLKYPVESGCNYEAEFLYTLDGTEYKTSYDFDSKVTNVGIEDYDYAVSNGELTFDVDIQSDENKTATVIIAKFKNNILEEIETDIISLSVGQNSITTPAVSYDSDNNIVYRVYFWKGLSDRISLVSKIPELSNEFAEQG